MKYFCFRFDVDTHKCLRDGVPNLIKLANELNVKFTFFVNFGKTFDHFSFIKSRLKSSKKNVHSNSLPAHVKLGLKDTLQVLLLNPTIGKHNPEILKEIVKSGHELGLHGGSNHEDWLKNASRWSSKKTEAEILWGYNQLRKYIRANTIYGFASPGFTTSNKVNRILSDLGFAYVADIHSDNPIEKIVKKNNLKLIPTNILGEPHGVGYIEHCRVLGMEDLQILSDFKNKLLKRKKLAIVYDHPYYAGVEELNLIREMINIVKKMNFKIVTMREISRIL